MSETLKIDKTWIDYECAAQDTADTVPVQCYGSTWCFSDGAYSAYDVYFPVDDDDLRYKTFEQVCCDVARDLAALDHGATTTRVINGDEWTFTRNDRRNSIGMFDTSLS